MDRYIISLTINSDHQSTMLVFNKRSQSVQAYVPEHITSFLLNDNNGPYNRIVRKITSHYKCQNLKAFQDSSADLQLKILVKNISSLRRIKATRANINGIWNRLRKCWYGLDKFPELKELIQNDLLVILAVLNAEIRDETQEIQKELTTSTIKYQGNDIPAEERDGETNEECDEESNEPGDKPKLLFIDKFLSEST